MDINPFNADAFRINDAEPRVPVLSHDFAGVEHDGMTDPVLVILMGMAEADQVASADSGLQGKNRGLLSCFFN